MCDRRLTDYTPYQEPAEVDLLLAWEMHEGWEEKNRCCMPTVEDLDRHYNTNMQE